jgi:hypothetical protein
MSTGRVLWIIWCCFWAGMWALSLLFFNVFALVLVPCLWRRSSCRSASRLPGQPSRMATS